MANTGQASQAESAVPATVGTGDTRIAARDPASGCLPQGVVPSAAALVERLSRHRTIGSAPREELEWLVAHGQLVHFGVGEVVSSPSQSVVGMYILLCGRVHLQQMTTGHKVADWQGGDVTGTLPYSRMVAAPGNLVVDEPIDALLVPREQLDAMIRECHEVTTTVVHVMLDRARFFTSTFLHDQKLKSLGKLAAGLAHELNNPAAAIKRFARVLPGAMAQVESAARAIGGAALTRGELEAVSRLSAACLADRPAQVRSPIEEAERESVITDWLEGHGLEADIADAVAQSPATVELLESLARSVRPEVLEAVLRWIASDCSVRRLAQEIDVAATRISDLVTAVRGFTRVDESAAPQPVDVGEGLSQTLAVLAAKARAKALRVSVAVEEGLPRVRAVGAELNQVWANLIDNALDAAPQSGSVEVTARRHNALVVVRVADNGPGIPEDIRERIFDPFFTTKDVGQGTGLGLDIVRRLVDRHDGEIEVSSKPGRTEFVVTLPAVQG